MMMSLSGMLVVAALVGTVDAPWLDQQEPGPSAEVYEVAGVRVIHRYADAHDFVAVNTYLLGGARQIDERSAGIEPLLLYASERGTARFPDTRAQEELVLTGSRITISAGPDWTLFGFRGLAEEFERTWDVYAERLMHPTLDSAAVEIARELLLTSARAVNDDPDAVVRRLAEELAYANHPYRFDVNGTEESLTGISIPEMRAYLERDLVKSRLLVVVVGAVDRARIETAIAGSFGQLAVGHYDWELPPPWKAEDSRVKVEERSLPTNYIVGYFSGPQASSKEAIWLDVGLAVLSSFVFQEIRDQGLSYAAGAYSINQGATGGALYVSTLFPKKSIEVFNEAIETLGKVVFRRSMLQDYMKGWRLNYHLQNETYTEQAGFLGRTYLYRGVIESPDEFVETLLEVAPSDMRRAIYRYVKNIQYAYLGDPEEVPEKKMREP